MGALTVIFVTSCFLCSFTDAVSSANGQDDSGLSKKARKLAQQDNVNALTTTEDPFFDFGLDDNNDIISQNKGQSTTEDPFFSFDDSFDTFLPPCSDLFEVDQRPGDNCDNSTIPEPEIRFEDPIFQRLIAQVWSDFQYKLNRDAELYGVVVDPFDVDAKLPEPIDLKQVGSGYSADVKMHGIKMYGLSQINLTSVEVTRSENLTDFRARIVFGFDHLEINGTYELKGFVGWWTLDSKGQQPFSIKMINATLAYEIEMDLISPDDWDARRCSPLESMTSSSDNVLIEDIRIPLRYDDVDFKFKNLGAFANTVVNGVGIYFLQTQEDTLVGNIRKAIKENVNSLIC